MSKFNTILVGALATALVAFVSRNQIESRQRPEDPKKGVKNIVLVHGAFADGSSWSKVIPLLEAKGFKVTAVQNPLTSLNDDVAAAKRIIALQDGPVLLVGHSWGGVVISEAGNDPKVAGLVYVSAFAPDNGESLNDVAKTATLAPGNEQVRVDAAGFLSLTPKGIFEDFAQDLLMPERKVILATQGQWAAFTTDEKVSKAAWHEKPSWFVIGGNDRMINPGLQRILAKKINAQSLELNSSHVPMLSQPAKVAAFIANAASNVDSKGLASK
jgi:pimeloyl-ACP methyl ester carboxylesterase